MANYGAFTFDELDKILKQMASGIEASEMHGVVTGLIVAGLEDKAAWLPILLEELAVDAAVDDDLEATLETLYRQVQAQIKSDSFGFEILVPEDQKIPMRIRTQQLSCWCRGFLCGLGLGGINKEAINSTIVKEAIQDISQFAYSEIECQEEENEEWLLVDLLEYIRIAVQNIEIELKTYQGDKVKEQTTIH